MPRRWETVSCRGSFFATRGLLIGRFIIGEGIGKTIFYNDTDDYRTREAAISDRRDLVDYDEPIAWGANTAGAKQAALAILAFCMPDDLAVRLHRKFAKEFVEPLDRDGWEVEVSRVRQWAEEQQELLERLGPERKIDWSESADSSEWF